MECDILVVGLGPGGSTAARFAAMGGAKVIAIDKRAEIGTPIQCAEGVSKSVFEKLELDADPRWLRREVSGVRLVSPNGNVIDLDDKNVSKVAYGYVLDRKAFDKDLAEHAAISGAELYLKTRFVSGERLENGKVRAHARNFGDDVTIDAKIIIAADGVASRVGPFFGIKTFVPLKYMESCVQYEMTNIKDIKGLEMFFGREVAPGGYIWIFPKSDNSANVGIGIIPTHSDHNAKYYLDKFLENPRLEGARFVELNAGGVPVSRPLKKTYGDNILIVGDAGRIVNPITGGGISTAISTGKYAGIVASEAIRGNSTDADALSRYEELWQDDFGKRLDALYKAQEIFVKMSDDELNDAAEALSMVNLEKISEIEILKAIAKTNVKLLIKLRSLL
jgi:digeranylgeranylglycerophospholipid reductase